MKKALARVLQRDEVLYEASRAVYHGIQHLAGTLVRSVHREDRQVIDEYLRTAPVKKLQLGCGVHLHPGWLNSDLEPPPGAIHLDVTRTFPFADRSFDRVYSEHLIEHVSYRQGAHLLSECRRVLKPGGRLRVATPDLAFLVELYRADKSDRQRNYIEWSTRSYIPDAPVHADTFVINNFVRDWGHKFIYDEKILRSLLETVGLRGVARYALGESDDAELRGLENEGRMPAGFLALETIVLEATRPDDR
jgi:predicted SAM-dependent methyltransferase